MHARPHPTLYQVNTRVWLRELESGLGRPATLDDIPDAALDRIAATGFDWVWFLSVWQTGPAGQQISRSNPGWRSEFQHTLPDLREDDIVGSGFAITGYHVHEKLGGDAALARLRERLRRRGLRLMLDFVPNHTGLDHPWVDEHPEYYIPGSQSDRASAPQNYTCVKSRGNDLILAYGRDPYFSGWPDTLQLNYANPATQEAMIGELLKISGQCDGVRCDMAMLVLPDVFQRTWGSPAPLFWPVATSRVREHVPGFCFMAEVYWDLEWTMQQQGFDYAYDKRLYDRLLEGHARPAREHLCGELAYQNKLARFLENHDEPRAATAFPHGMHEAAAVVTFLTPGLRFFHQGEFEGRLKRISPHLGRAPDEAVDESLRKFYSRLLTVLQLPVVHHGQWQLLDRAPAWEGNDSNDDFICFSWQDDDGSRLLVAVNYAGHSSQCYVRLAFPGLDGRQWTLRDLLGESQYQRDGGELQSRGLYLDLGPWQYHAFVIQSA
jgi:glycosidase